MWQNMQLIEIWFHGLYDIFLSRKMFKCFISIDKQFLRIYKIRQWISIYLKQSLQIKVLGQIKLSLKCGQT